MLYSLFRYFIIKRQLFQNYFMHLLKVVIRNGIQCKIMLKKGNLTEKLIHF